MFVAAALIATAYWLGKYLDDRAQHNYFIGGLFPYVGWRTTYHGPMQMKGFFTAWLWKCVCWNAKIGPRK